MGRSSDLTIFLGLAVRGLASCVVLVARPLSRVGPTFWGDMLRCRDKVVFCGEMLRCREKVVFCGVCTGIFIFFGVFGGNAGVFKDCVSGTFFFEDLEAWR